MLRLRHQDFILVRGINAADRLDQFSGIPTETDGRIFEMPGGDDDFHRQAIAAVPDRYARMGPEGTPGSQPGSHSIRRLFMKQSSRRGYDRIVAIRSV